MSYKELMKHALVLNESYGNKRLYTKKSFADVPEISAKLSELKQLSRQAEKTRDEIKGLIRGSDYCKDTMRNTIFKNVHDIDVKGRQRRALLVLKSDYISVEKVEEDKPKENPKKEMPIDPYKNIHYGNLNDLQSAKFLTDEEKRKVLGLPPIKGGLPMVTPHKAN